MATVTERPDSRRWSGGACEFRYRVRGTASDTAAMAALLAAAPQTYQGLVRQLNPSLEAVEGTVDESAGTGQWDAAVNYVRPDRQSPPESTIGTVRMKWHTGGGTQHVTACIRTAAAYGAPGINAQTSDTGDLVNYDQQGQRAEGIEIGCPVFAFTVSKVFAVDELPSPGYLFWATDTVNDAPWTVTDTVTGQTYTFDTAEALFKGVEMNEVRADGGVELVFEFEASPNRDDITVGEIGPIAKYGWQRLEVKYRPKVLNGLGVMGAEPIAAYVQDLYYSTDFGNLGV